MFGRMMASALALTGVAYAQTPQAETPPTPDAAAATSGRVTYDAAFFAQFNPQTALDLANNTPGFNLDTGDERRGFSGAVGNVLIDGVRPTAKNQGIDAILGRIPASQVLRVELLRGADVAGDASGQAVLLNIVRTPSAGSGVYEVGFEYSDQFQQRAAPRFDVSYTGRNGQVEWGVGSRVFTQNRNLPGDRVFLDGAGVYGGRAEIDNPRDLWDPYVSGNIAFPLLGGRFSATSEINPEWYFEAENNFHFFDDADNPTGHLLSGFKEEGSNGELGLNYDRDIGAWSLALVGLISRSTYENHEVADSLSGFDALHVTQDIENEGGETILRGTLSRRLGARHRIEFGGEAALNTLDATNRLVIDDGGGPDVIPLVNGNVSIEEERTEVFGVHTWRPTDQWSVEARLAWENSTLTFTGDTNQEVPLDFWKPSLQLTRTFAGNNQLRLRYYRDVGQLDFNDFTTAAGIADNLINGGNPDLVPQTDWRTEFGGDFRFPGGAALGITLTHHDIEDLSDVVLIVAPNPEDDPADPDADPSDDFVLFDAPGNIGDGEAWSLDLNFSASLGRFLPGARITVNAEFWDTEVTDPVTGQPRIFSYQPESEVDISFRQDFSEQRWSWGVEYSKDGETQGYRFNEVDTQEEGPWVDLWWETTALPNNMKLRLLAANIADGEVVRDRRFFGTPLDGDPTNDNRNGPLFLQQLSDRHFETSPWLIVELSGTF
jgi:hypothetical protein